MSKEHHRKKMVAPIIITILFLAIVVGYGTVYFMIGLPIAVWLLLALILAALAVAMIYVLVGRIREIKGGEEDDLIEMFKNISSSKRLLTGGV